jgi:hypothetical protein
MTIRGRKIKAINLDTPKPEIETRKQLKRTTPYGAEDCHEMQTGKLEGSKTPALWFREHAIR